MYILIYVFVYLGYEACMALTGMHAMMLLLLSLSLSISLCRSVSRSLSLCVHVSLVSLQPFRSFSIPCTASTAGPSLDLEFRVVGVLGLGLLGFRV